MRLLCVFSLLLAVAGPAPAEQPKDFLAAFAAAAQKSDSGFSGFSASRGERFFKSPQNGDWSCSTCHTDNPIAFGRHVVTGKRIAPLSPNNNPRRFTDAGKVGKWFRRNCNDVLKRECSSQEKGDVLTYLLSLEL